MRKRTACSDMRGPVYEKKQILSGIEEKSTEAGVDQGSPLWGR